MSDDRDIRQILKQREMEDKLRELGRLPNDEFLRKQMQLESSGGIDTQHPEIKQGLQEGTSAIGDYGLMPNTIKELMKRNPEDPSMQKLSAIPEDDVPFVLNNNNQLQTEVARKLADHVLNRQQGDEDRATYAWQYGHNLTPSRISEQKLDDNDRVKKFRQLRDFFNKKNK